MADLFCWWQQDLVVLPTGDLLYTEGTIEGEQRVLRRLLTTPGKYIWHLEYGAGLPNYVGQPAVVQSVASLIMSQMMIEEAVTRDPLPTVSVKGTATGYLYANIKYVDAETGRPVSMNFDVKE